MNDLPWTGERLVTSLTNEFGVIEHLHRYALAREFCENKEVLDIACGEGYGSNLLSLIARKVIGVDISEVTISHASEKYRKKNLTFKVGNTSRIPCENNSFDVVVSFETIEHHDEHKEMFDEITRVLKKDGILIISSPEKSIYSSRDPNNLFHVKELELKDLLEYINKYFKHIVILNQRFVIGSLLEPLNTCNSKFQVFDGDFNNIENKLTESIFFNKPFFNIIICCNKDFTHTSLPLVSFFNGYKVYENIISEKDRTINSILHSKKYKLGSYLLKPIFILSKLWGKFVR